jgi:Flp pilus assembly protein TadG
MLIRAVTNRLLQLRRDDRGTAAVEFALITPFLLTLYLGSMEASALFTVDKRVNTISATVGDLVGQWNPTEGTLYTTATTDPLPTYFAAAKGIMAPYPITAVKQVVSLIFVSSTGTTKVIWSKANGTGATPRTQGSSFAGLGSTTTTNDVARGGCIIASEVSYSYKPLLGAVFTVALNLSHVNYFIPRYGATDTIEVDSPTLAHADTACTTGVY